MTENSVHTFKSSAELAYDLICRKILSGDLKPGQRLTRRDMATLTGVSIIPVIEALHRLEDEGLVESEPRLGSRVVLLTDDVIHDRLMLREAIECQIARILARSISGEQANHLKYLAETIDTTPRDEEYEEEFGERHFIFHKTLAEYSNCKSLIAGLRRISLFQIIHRQVTASRIYADSFPGNWHRRIIDAILTGDPNHAEQSIREHIQRSGIFRETNNKEINP